MREASRHCSTCETQRLIVAAKPNHVLHLLLTLVTGGLWFPVWAWLSMGASKGRCATCGTVVSFKEPRAGIVLRPWVQFSDTERRDGVIAVVLIVVVALLFAGYR